MCYAVHLSSPQVLDTEFQGRHFNALTEARLKSDSFYFGYDKDAGFVRVSQLVARIAAAGAVLRVHSRYSDPPPCHVMAVPCRSRHGSALPVCLKHWSASPHALRCAVP